MSVTDVTLTEVTCEARCRKFKRERDKKAMCIEERRKPVREQIERSRAMCDSQEMVP